MTEVHVQINGLERVAEVASNETLADLLRDRLRLPGTRIGCEQGVCGACPVLLDGEPVRPCLVLAVPVEGRVLEPVEGLSSEARRGGKVCGSPCRSRWWPTHQTKQQ